jgi:TRAP-type C4-dicarboxylate transport system substrate-binding protein
VISTVIWNDLSAEEQQWLQEAVHESAEYQKKIWQEATEQALAEVQKAGVEIFRPDKTPFTETVASLYEEYRNQPEIYNLIQEIKAVR